MKILTTDRFVDLEAPVYMNDEQLQKFVAGMEHIFGHTVQVRHIIENKKEIRDVRRHPRKFSVADQISLADPTLSNEDLAKSMGKNPFAIQMKRGSFLMALQDWAGKKGRTKITSRDVEEYIRETR